MGKRTCIAFGCHNSTLTADLKFHRIPPNQEKAFAWLRAVQRSDLLQHPSKFKSHRICSAHFLRNMYNNVEDWNSRLMSSAVPKLFSENVDEDSTSSDAHPTPISMVDKVCQTEVPRIQEQTTQVDNMRRTRSYRTEATQTPGTESLVTLRNEIIKVQNQLRAEKLRIKRKRKMTVTEMLDKLNTIAAIFIRAQFTNVNRMPQRYRFSSQMYSLCLWLYHYSPACYKVLREFLIIPSPRGICRHVQYLFDKPGSCETTRRFLKERLKFDPICDHECLRSSNC